MWEGFPTQPGPAAAALAERWWHPEITYEEDPRWPGSGTYRGRDDVVAAFESYQEVLGEAEISVEDVIEGQSGVVAMVRISGTSPVGDVPWDHVWAYLCRIRDGTIVYLRAYWDPGEALGAAGVDSS